MSDFVEYLVQELNTRKKTNPGYSLRAFARSLQLEPSFLSKLLTGKRRVTPMTLERLSRQLNLDRGQFEKFMEASAVPTAKPRVARHPLSYKGISADEFEVVADLIHNSILEMTTLRNFEPDYVWIADRLNRSVTEVASAVNRLVRLGYLQIRPNGKWVDISGAVTTTDNKFTTLAFMKHQKQILEKAIEALESVPLDRRDQSAITIAAHPRDIPKIKEKIKRFRRSLASFIEARKNKTQVYNLSISFYPVTRD